MIEHLKCRNVFYFLRDARGSRSCCGRSGKHSDKLLSGAQEGGRDPTQAIGQDLLRAAERREWPELLTAMLFRHRRAGWHREHYDIFSSALLQVTFKRWYAPAVGGDKIALGKAELPRAFCRRQSQSTRSRDSENNLPVHSS